MRNRRSASPTCGRRWAPTRSERGAYGARAIRRRSGRASRRHGRDPRLLGATYPGSPGRAPRRRTGRRTTCSRAAQTGVGHRAPREGDDLGRRARAGLRGQRGSGGGNLNCPLSVTRSAAFFCVRVLLDPDAPPCAGAHRPVAVMRPGGLLLNAQSRRGRSGRQRRDIQPGGGPRPFRPWPRLRAVRRKDRGR